MRPKWCCHRALHRVLRLAADTYYLDGTGDCLACPIVASSWDGYRGLVIIVSTFFGLVAVTYVLLALLAWHNGGSIVSTMGHAGQLLTWAVLTLQGVAQVATVTSPSLPPTISRIFSSVGWTARARAFNVHSQ